MLRSSINLSFGFGFFFSFLMEESSATNSYPSCVQLPFSFPDVCERSCSDFVFDHASGLVALRTPDYRIQFFSLFENFEVSQVCNLVVSPFALV